MLTKTENEGMVSAMSSSSSESGVDALAYS